MGRLSTRRSSSACVSASIQCRSSTPGAGLLLAFAQQQAFEPVEGALAALRRVEPDERAVRPAGRPGVTATPAACPGASRPASAPGRSPWRGRYARRRPPRHGSSAEQLQHREIGRGLAVGHRGALEHPPARVRWEWTNSYTRRDFPTPASPTSAATWPCPASACSRAWCKAASSSAAPQSGVSPRAARPASGGGYDLPRPAQRPPRARSAP